MIVNHPTAITFGIKPVYAKFDYYIIIDIDNLQTKLTPTEILLLIASSFSWPESSLILCGWALSKEKQDKTSKVKHEKTHYFINI